MPNTSKTANRSIHPLWWLPFPLLLLLGLIAFFLRPDNSLPAPSHPQARVVEVITLIPASEYAVEQRFLGRLEARRTSQLGFELPGTVESVAVEEGDSVDQNDTLATLDDARLQARKNELQAVYHEAHAAEILAEADFERTRQLVRDDVATPAELDAAIQERDAANATVRRIQAQLESVEVDLGETRLLAPFDGIIQRRLIDEGAVVSAGQPVLEALESGHHEVRAGFSPEAAASLAIGEVIQAYRERDQPIEATLLRKLPVRNDQTRTVDLIFSLSADDLLPGDLLELPIMRHEQSRGFWLPISALTESERGLWACYVVNKATDQNPTLELRQVEILHQTAERAFVRGALKPGDQVVADGLQKLTPGLSVHPEPRDETES